MTNLKKVAQLRGRKKRKVQVVPLLGMVLLPGTHFESSTGFRPAKRNRNQKVKFQILCFGCEKVPTVQNRENNEKINKIYEIKFLFTKFFVKNLKKIVKEKKFNELNFKNYKKMKFFHQFAFVPILKWNFFDEIPIFFKFFSFNFR